MLLQNGAVVTKLMAVDDAVASGARALFGEKYGEEVRVVSMGRSDAVAESGRPKAFSIELCGGTHAARTGDIGTITILGESAVGAGVRRIEALTADAARRHRAEEAQTLAAWIKGRAQGLYLMPPFGSAAIAARVMEALA